MKCAAAPSDLTKRKRKKVYEEEINALSKIISKEVDEAEHFGMLIASYVRQCPKRLRVQMHADVLATAAKYVQFSD